MFAYISWYTVALLWIFCMEKKMRKCNVILSIYRAVLSTDQYIQIHDFISIDETCISGYIRIWASKRSYIRLWTLYICVQVRIYAYICVCDILQKHAWLADSNWESQAYCKAALTTTPPALIPNGVSYDICLLNWGSTCSPFKFEPRCLLADVGRPVLSWQHPSASHDGWFRKAGFQV